MTQPKKVSIIVPCYNSAKYIKTTLKCLINQYYKNTEIICVDDGSTDSTAKILAKAAKKEQRIKVITLEKNQGLFNARLCGAQKACGDYILFVDSDDMVSPNWVGALVFKAESAAADLVYGDMRKKGDVLRDNIDPQKCSYHNFDPVRLSDFDNSGMEIFDRFMHTHGLCSHYHYVWNKLIKKQLWDRCAADFYAFRQKYPHLVMGEDIAFSLTLLIFANHVVNIHHEYYIYCVHEAQSVNTDNLGKLNKNVKDLLAVFSYFKEILQKYGLFDKYEEQYTLFKQRFGVIYGRLARELALPDETKDFIQEQFGCKKIQNPANVKSEQFLNLMTNTADAEDEYEKLVELIHSDKIKVVSFDVFDTLVLRPFAKPSDIFLNLNKPFMELFGITSFVDFSSIRAHAEYCCHKLQKAANPDVEEPTLGDIYDTLSKIYGYDREKLRIIEQLEIENEIKFAYPRKSAVELFSMAKNAGKRVIISSDMYLPGECIEAILQKCGVSGYEKLYLSSKLHLTKHSGRLYSAILNDFSQIGAGGIMHIGDNVQSDILRAEEYGITAIHFPKTMDLFFGRNSNIYSGKSFDKICFQTNGFADMEIGYYGYTGVRCAMAVVANKIFDFPFVSFNKVSDFNGDPNFIGYYAVGMHIYSVARWLIEQTKNKGLRTIHFAARDGYLIKQAYDILTENMEGVPSSNYLRVSRKAFAIADINSFNDIYSIRHKMNFASQTPNNIFDLFCPVMSKKSKDAYNAFKNDNREFCETKFEEIVSFSKFMASFYNQYLTDADFAGYNKKLKDYFSDTIAENDVFFDIGYSGRVELVLNRLLGRRIKSFYIHSNDEQLNKRAAVGDIDNTTFYDFKPIVTGVVREHILSETAPSTIGYEFVDGKLVPVFDVFDMNYPTVFLTRAMQDAALEFVSDMHRLFSDNAEILHAKNFVLSRPFEYYLHSSRLFDRQVLAELEFEDDLGEGHAVSGMDFWERLRRRVWVNKPESTIPDKIIHSSLLTRALYFLLFDRKQFKEKFKKRFSKNNEKKD